MAQRLALYFDGERAAWLDAEQRLIRGTLDEFATAIDVEDAEISVLIPGEDVLLTRAPLPPIRGAARRLRAVRYALEDRLAGRIEQLHFALAGAPDRDGETSVAVVANERMAGLCETLGAAEITAVRILPDYMALAEPEAEHWQLVALDDRLLVRTGATAGFSCDTDLWPVLAASLPTPSTADVRAENAAQARTLIDVDWGEDTDPPALDCSVYGDTDTLLASLLAAPDAVRNRVNLRQDTFALPSQLRSQWRPLILTGVLAAVWLVIAIVGRGIQTWQLDQRIDALHQQTLAAFHDAFPNVEQVNDLRAQAEEGIRELRGAGGMFPLVQAVASVIGQTRDLQVQSMQYRDGALSMSLNGANVQSVETLRAGFAQRGHVQLSVESANAGVSGVQIRATVSPGTRS